MALTADQTTLRRLRADIGDATGVVFDDPSLADLLTDATLGGEYVRVVERALWRMVTDAALLARFLEGVDDVEARQAAHKALLANWKAWREATRAAGNTPRLAQGGMRLVTATAEEG